MLQPCANACQKILGVGLQVSHTQVPHAPICIEFFLCVRSAAFVIRQKHTIREIGVLYSPMGS